MTEKKKIEFPSHQVPILLIMDIVARSYNKSASLQDLVKYSGKSSSYVKSAITAAKQLQMIYSEVLNNTECYKTLSVCGEELTATPSDDKKRIVFRKWLQKWEPFIIYIKYISSGDSSCTAIRKTSSFFDFPNKLDFIEKLFIAWGKATKIINNDGALNQNDFDIENRELTNMLEHDVDNDYILRMYLVNNISDEVFSWLLHDEIEEIISGLQKYSSDPRNAIECGGRAYEDFLRRIAVHLDIDVTTKNGISEVAGTIYSAKDTNGQSRKVIHSKHNNISTSIGDMRNMAGHSKEAKTMERWDIRPSLAFGFMLLVISSIKSIYYYVFANKLMVY